MNLNKNSQEISFPAPDKSRWITFAWDGCYYYLISRNSCLIYQYNCAYMCIGHFEGNRQYNRICFDYQSDCFWAASKHVPNTVYKLNHSLQEVNNICFTPNNGIGGIITGLSYNCACNKLLVSFQEKVVSLDTIKERFQFLNNLYGGCITDILSIYPGYIVTQETRRGQFVRLFDHCNCEIDKKLIPNSMRVEQILYNVCHEIPVFCSLVTKKKCYSVIILQCIPSEVLGFQINCCYLGCCKKCCHCTKQDEIGCHDDVSVIQSVALVEAALAHILNTEGEKLQKVLAETDDMQTIMCVNQQVIQTIIHVTHLEMILYDKLSVLEKNCCDKPRFDDCLPEIVTKIKNTHIM